MSQASVTEHCPCIKDWSLERDQTICPESLGKWNWNVSIANQFSIISIL